MNASLVYLTTEHLNNNRVLLTIEHGPSGCFVEESCSSEEVEQVKVRLQDELCLIIEQVEWWVH